MDLLSHYQENPLPFARLLGIELVSVEADRVVAEMTIREDLCTSPAIRPLPQGRLSGLDLHFVRRLR